MAKGKIIQGKEQLDELHPKEKQSFINFINDILDMGFDVIVTDVLRTIAKSAELYKQNSKNAKPGFSSHNYAFAIDFNVVNIATGKRYMKATPLKEWIATGIPKLGKEKYGMRWGGDFNGYPDPIHFDYNNRYPTKVLYAKAVKQFGSIDKLDVQKLIVD
jgi:hypothetical protein